MVNTSNWNQNCRTAECNSCSTRSPSDFLSSYLVISVVLQSSAPTLRIRMANLFTVAPHALHFQTINSFTWLGVMCSLPSARLYWFSSRYYLPERHSMISSSRSSEWNCRSQWSLQNMHWRGSIELFRTGRDVHFKRCIVWSQWVKGGANVIH